MMTDGPAADPDPVPGWSGSASDAPFRKVLEAVPGAVVLTDGGGRIEMVNAQAERMFGYRPGELPGQDIETLLPERFRSGHARQRRDYLARPQTRPMGAGRDLYGRHKDGSEFPVEIGLNPIHFESGLMILSTIIDISERKLKEAHLLQALREKDLLLNEVHHRVKNNLQFVQSLLSLHFSRIGDPRLDGILLDCQSRIKSMVLIHQTLYQSHNFTMIDFASVLKSLIAGLIGSYAPDPDRIAWSVEAENVPLPLDVAVPCGLMVNELVTNALKHAFPDGRPGRIHAQLSQNGADGALLSVSDDGIGLPSDILPEHGETLGLQLVSLLADQIGGRLSLTRRDPTTFSLAFPLAAA